MWKISPVSYDLGVLGLVTGEETEVSLVFIHLGVE